MIFVLALLASCSNQSTDDNVPTGEHEGWLKGDCIYYRGDSDIPIESLQSRFLGETNVSFSTTGGTEADKLFILGKYDNELSSLAYSKMERAFSNYEANAIFTIYTDGSSVAIAYDSLTARYAAIEYFFTEFYNLDLTKSGVIITEEFNAKAYVNEKREAQRNEGLLSLEGILSAGAVKELRSLYSLYDEDIYIWLANLYDPDIGGFYYSESGRDTQGFLPDLESTAQALMFMTESGMLSEYGNKYKDALSLEMKNAILGFAKESQDSADGYFYHAQWGKSISPTRLGRDLGWATRIISGLGYTPYWDTPNGVRGEYGAPGATAASLTEALRMSDVIAVSRVTPTALPAYLKDINLFKKHLAEDYDWENDSYRAGNAIESELGQIQNAGSSYTEALIEFLSSRQKSNGLWENEISYDSVNGLMKISGVYTSLKKIIPNAEKAMESAITVLKSDETAAHVCSVYNPWEAVANILTSIEKVSGSKEVDKLRAQFREEAEELIRITFGKLSVFKKDDGGFSYYIKYSAANSQGSAVALDKSIESDVNATMICTNSTIKAMFNVFGISQVERYYPADYAYISDTLNELGTIVKDEILPAEEITFDDYDASWGDEEGGVVKYPDDFAENTVGDDDKDAGGSYKWFQSSIVKNPSRGAEKSDLVLYTKSNVYVGAEKALADKPSSTRFKIFNAGLDSLGNCYVYDADMYFVPGYGKTNSSGKTTSDPIIQLFFMTESLPCASVNFSVYTEDGVDYIKIGENYAGIDGKESNVAGGIPMGQWVNIRLEFYKNYEISADGKATVYKPVLKIYVNGKYQGDCDANITGTDSSGAVEYYDRKIDQISISYYRYLASEIYFNNVLVERCNKKYTEEKNPDAIVEIPLPDEPMRESYGFEDGLLNTSNVVNKVRVVDFGVSKYINATEGQTYNPFISYSITADPKNAANHVLKVSALKSDEFDKPSRTEINLYNSGATGTDYIFFGKFYYSADAIGINGDLTHIFFLNTLEGQAYSIRIKATKTNGVFKLSLIENNKASGDTGTGKTICEDILCDEWFTLKIVFHRTGLAETTGASIYLNDELIMKDMSYKSAALTQNPIMKVALVHQKTNNSTLYLDDLSFARSGEIEESVESEEQTATFTDGFNTKYVHSYSYNGKTQLDVDDIDPIAMENLYTKFYLIADPEDAANQVLRAVNKNGGTNAGYTKVDISNENPTGNCYTFETKMYIETYSANYNLSQIKFVDKSGAVAFSTYVSIDKTSGKVKIATTGSGAYPSAGTNLLDGSDIEVKNAKWFKVRMEFYHMGESASEANTFVKLYINEALAYDGLGYCAFGAAIDHVEIVHCKTATSSAVYYDDISLTKTDKEYSAASK